MSKRSKVEILDGMMKDPTGRYIIENTEEISGVLTSGHIIMTI